MGTSVKNLMERTQIKRTKIKGEQIGENYKR